MKKVIPIMEEQVRKTQNQTQTTINSNNILQNSLQISQVPIKQRQHERKDQSLSKSKEIKICNICYERNGEAKIGTCSHKFCKECLLFYVEQKLKYLEQIGCCSEGCHKKITTKYQGNALYIYHHLPQKTKEKVKQNLKYYHSLKVRKVCKKCFKNKQKGQCKCQQFIIQLPPQIKECEECKNWIQKQKGCNHMKCKCGNQFCFDCGQQWQNNHICEYKIPKRQGIALVLCSFLQLFVLLFLLLIVLVFLLFIALAVCFISAMFYGFMIFFKLLQLMKTIQSSCKGILFICLILILPIIWALFLIPGFFIPIINICYDQVLFLDPSILRSLCESSYGCLQLVKLI